MTATATTTFVQNDRVAAGAMLIREIVTSRVTVLQRTTIRAVFVESTNVASLPPLTAR
jgi:hypothetical protein